MRKSKSYKTGETLARLVFALMVLGGVVTLYLILYGLIMAL